MIPESASLKKIEIMSGNQDKSRLQAMIVVLAAVLVLLAIFYLPKLFGGPDIEALTDAALNDPSHQAQIRAAQELAQLGEPALESLRKIASESANPGVLSVCILGISRQSDYESMDIIIAKLDNPESSVRSSAATALRKMLGRDFHFPVDGSKENRDRVRDEIIKDWNLYNGSELFEFNKNRSKEN